MPPRASDGQVLLFISANYRDAADGEAGEAVAIVIDTQSDAVLEVATDTRCGATGGGAGGRRLTLGLEVTGYPYGLIQLR